MSTSDPRCVASVQGPAYSRAAPVAQQFTTVTKWNNLHPTWNETHEFEVTSFFTQSLVVSSCLPRPAPVHKVLTRVLPLALPPRFAVA